MTGLHPNPTLPDWLADLWQHRHDADDTHDADALREFVTRVSPVGLDDAVLAIRARVLETGGLWLDADSASHLLEIQLFNIAASGATAREAARNWIKCARALLDWQAGRVVTAARTPPEPTRPASAPDPQPGPETIEQDGFITVHPQP